MKVAVGLRRVAAGKRTSGRRAAQIAYEAPSTVGIMCRAAKKKVKGLEDFHFHTLRPTYTSNLLSGGAKPKDVQELLGHSDVSTTMNIYAHSTREAKRTSARLLDKVVGGE